MLESYAEERPQPDEGLEESFCANVARQEEEIPEGIT